MSFSMEIKNELVDLERNKTERIAELSAFVRNNGKFNKRRIYLSTENMMVSKRIILLFRDIYQIKVNVISNKSIAFNRGVVFEMTIEEKISYVLESLSVWDEKSKFLPEAKEYIVPGDEEKRSYLAGVFLACGSISDPAGSNYHLELLIPNRHEAVFVQRLLNTYDLNCKIIKRDRKYMLYIKEAEKISDFLKIIGASKAVIYYENERVYRFQKNVTNRLNNMEQANVDKTFLAAAKQIFDIELIKETIGLEALDEKTKETAIFRLKYPESSLLELSEIMSLETKNPISKSGLNHRFRKIAEIADKLKELK